MEYTIKNEYVTAVINSKAGEVISFMDNRKKEEMIWCRDPKFWYNCNPILFPLTGTPDEGTYMAKGQKYAMSNHGFMRRAEFKFIEQFEDSCTLLFDGNDESKGCYPYKFRILLKYKLNGHKIEINVHLDNLDEEKLPFMMGFHPAFNCPTANDPLYNECYFLFDKEENIDGKTFDRLYFKDVFSEEQLSYFYYNDVVKSDNITLCIGKKQVLRVSKKNYDTIGFWRKPDFPFVCIEPWYFKNNLEKGHNFRKADENNLLESQDEFECNYEWEIF